MKDTVLSQIFDALEGCTTEEFSQWISHWPGQFVCIATLFSISEQQEKNSFRSFLLSFHFFLSFFFFFTWKVHATFLINFTKEIDSALLDVNGMKSSLNETSRKLENQMAKTIALLRKELPPANRLNYRALLILLIQAQNILNRLIEKHVESAEDFDWMGQMRYYFNENKIEVKMLLSKLLYGFEYIGNKCRMVITPLTERCYRTVFVALNQHFGLALQVWIGLCVPFETSRRGSNHFWNSIVGWCRHWKNGNCQRFGNSNCNLLHFIQLCIRFGLHSDGEVFQRTRCLRCMVNKWNLRTFSVQCECYGVYF